MLMYFPTQLHCNNTPELGTSASDRELSKDNGVIRIVITLYYAIYTPVLRRSHKPLFTDIFTRKIDTISF